MVGFYEVLRKLAFTHGIVEDMLLPQGETLILKKSMASVPF